MKIRDLFRFVLALTAMIEVTPVPVRDFELGQNSVWENIGKRLFYGPWNILVKQNGDYIDYNDYDARIEQFRPDSLAYEDLSIAHGYLEPTSLTHDRELSGFNTALSSMGLTDFRTGIQTGNWIDRNTGGRLKEGFWKDVAAQKIDKKNTDGSAILATVE